MAVPLLPASPLCPGTPKPQSCLPAGLLTLHRGPESLLDAPCLLGYSVIHMRGPTPFLPPTGSEMWPGRAQPGTSSCLPAALRRGLWHIICQKGVRSPGLGQILVPGVAAAHLALGMMCNSGSQVPLVLVHLRVSGYLRSGSSQTLGEEPLLQTSGGRPKPWMGAGHELGLLPSHLRSSGFPRALPVLLPGPSSVRYAVSSPAWP